MYTQGDLIITKDKEVYIYWDVLEPDGSELHSMLVFDYISVMDFEDEEETEIYIDWLENARWFKLYDLQRQEFFWENENFLNI